MLPSSFIVYGVACFSKYQWLNIERSDYKFSVIYRKKNLKSKTKHYIKTLANLERDKQIFISVANQMY